MEEHGESWEDAERQHMLERREAATGKSNRLIIVFSIAFVACVLAAFLIHGSHESNKLGQLHTATYENAAAATDNKICSSIAIDIIENKGGNAVDGAVAAALCLGVVNPFASGIGGGGYMVLRLANGSEEAIDFRETAPSAATADMYIGQLNKSVEGGLAVATPAELRGLFLAHQRHGNATWRDLVEPAASLATSGFTVHALLALRIEQNREKILRHAELRNFLSNAHGELASEGDLIKNEKLGETLQAVADHGPDALYTGARAENLAADVRSAGGILTAADLGNYSAKVLPPTVASFRGLRVLGVPLSASGGAAVSLALNVLDGMPMARAGADTDLSVEGRGFTGEYLSAVSLHYMVEALKFAFGQRMGLGDPSKYPEAQAVFDNMTSPSFASALRSEIAENHTFPPAHYMSSFSDTVDDGTAHIAVYDKQGNAASVTSTVNHSFGSKVLSPSTGILLNNQMNDFSVSPNSTNEFGLPPSKANEIAPGKRPLSSISSSIALNQSGKVEFVWGASGGPTIISSVVQTLLYAFIAGNNPQTAVSMPRMHDQLSTNPDKLVVERTFPQSIADALAALGHRVDRMEELLADGHGIGNTQMIRVLHESGLIAAACDPRKKGEPAGF